MSNDSQFGSAQRVVNSYNDWDPLEEVIVGSVRGAVRPGFEPALSAFSHAATYRAQGAQRRAEADIEAAQEQLDNFARVLEEEGVIVHRPTPMDFFTPVRTPTFEVASQNCSACPRDILLVVGDEIIEATMSMRARFFEYLPYRELLKEYFRKGARWSAAPKPSMSDELYVEGYSTDEQGFDADTHPGLTDFEPCFDAASFARIGRDIFYQADVVTNDFGAQWLARHLGPDFRFHRAKFKDRHPQHIDATMVPLRPGLVMMNPERYALDDTRTLFQENGWEIIEGMPSLSATIPKAGEASHWISMNVFNIDEDTVVCEEQEEPMIKLLESVGFRVIAIPFSRVRPFGGAFHCCTIDIRRRGGLQSYFPKLDARD